MSSEPSNSHLVLLKVMQLTRPGIAFPQVITCDPEDFPGNGLNNYLLDDIRTVKELENITAGQFLLTPQTMQPVFLGETFSCYLHIYNTTDREVKNLSFKVELTTSSQNFTEYNYFNSSCVLRPRDSLCHIVNYRVKTLDIHTLTCEISYLNNANEAYMSYRKRFQFPVSELFNVSSKFNNIENSDEVLLNIQIHNKSNEIIWLDEVTPYFTEEFDVRSLNPGLKRFNHILPDDSYQYIFCLTMKSGVIYNMIKFLHLDYKGTLEIKWGSRTAGRGQLTTVKLQQKSTIIPDLKVSLESLPCEVKLEEPFEFRCRIVNTSEKQIELVLKLASLDSSGLLWSGVSNRNIGSLDSGSTIDVSLSAFPIYVGFQPIMGLNLIDTSLNQTYEFDNLGTVYVV